MSFKPVDENTVGLYSKNETIQAAYVALEKGGFSVKQCLELSLSKTEDVKPLYMLCNDRLTVASLNESDVLVRRLRLKLTRDKDIDEAFIFQAEPHLPYPIETAIVDKITVEKDEGSTLVVFLATKKEYVQNVLNFWEERGIDPEMVSAEPIALNSLLNATTAQVPLQYCVHVGQHATLSVLIKEGKLLASHAIQMGWNDLNKNSDLFLETFNLLDTQLKGVVDRLLQMILWNYLSLLKETKIKDTPLLYVVGEGANVPQLSSLIATTLGIQQGELSDFSGSCPLPQLNRFSIPIGLALTAQPNQVAVNFRKEEYVYTTPWKRFKKPLLIYSALCLGLACSLLLFGLSYLKSKENGLKSHFLNLLAYTQKVDSPLSVKELNAEQISHRVDLLEHEIKSRPESYPLLPNLPRVSDVLVWLSTHPKLICKEEDCIPFTIDLFNYSLVKRPEITKKNEKYQVKVDLEFSTSSPRLAREFHDALITPNDFVDPKGEIKWTATKGKYRTSFYLKDKTIYP